LQRTLTKLTVARAELDRLPQTQRAQRASHLAAQASPAADGWIVAERPHDIAPADLRLLAADVLARTPGLS
jgi:hypothetical protein